MRKMRAYKAPYTDSTGAPIWCGNTMRFKIFSLFSFEVKYINGVWYLYDGYGAYIDDRNRYKPLGNYCKRMVIQDDRVVLK